MYYITNKDLSVLEFGQSVYLGTIKVIFSTFYRIYHYCFF